MSFLSQLSNTLQNALGFGVQHEGKSHDAGGRSPATGGGHGNTSSSPAADETSQSRLNYTSFSAVDQLMARATLQAIHEASNPGSKAYEGVDHWNFHVDQVLRSIEMLEEEDPLLYNIRVTTDRMEAFSLEEGHRKRKREGSIESHEKHLKRKRVEGTNNEDDGSYVSTEEAEEQTGEDSDQGGSEEDQSDELEPNVSFGPEPSGENEEGEQAPVDGPSIGNKYREQLRQCSEMVQAGWKEDTILAYLKLDRYGYEPIFQRTWKADFLRFPPILFAEDDQNSFIRALGSSEWRGIHAFDNFCKVGAEVRIAHQHYTHAKRRPEALLKKYINDYLKWAWKDAKLMDDIENRRVPNLVAVAHTRLAKDASGAIHKETTEQLEARLRKRLQNYGDELLRSLRQEGPTDEAAEYIIDPPTLFGLAIVDMVVGVFAYEPITGVQRSIGFFNFENHVSSTEHAIRVALLLHWARYSMLRIKEVLKSHGRWAFEDVGEVSEWNTEVSMVDLDPDA